MHPIALTCHPSTPSDAVRGIAARAERAGRHGLALGFCVAGDLTRVRVPPRACVPRLVSDLWQHTCFEAFIGVDGTPAYHELNLAPSGDWGAFVFERYRDGMPLTDETLAPPVHVRVSSARLELETRIALDRLSPSHGRAPLRLGLAAVIEHGDGTLSYWALRHPPGQPDFHHADAFAVRLAAARPG
jgi:hypothetical protein